MLTPRHLRERVSLVFLLGLSLFAISPPQDALAADRPTPMQVEFFESRIRPVLVEHCYKCHNSAKTAKGGLAVDDRAALLKGGDGGAVVVPGKPEESRLLAVLRHEIEGLNMPKGGPKLDKSVVADLEKWIAMGVPDPRDSPPSASDLAKATSWATVLEKRKQWWSFQPIRKVAPPEVPGNRWSDHPIDRFVLAKLRDNGLEPAETADPATLVRRLYLSLIGLPPSAEEVHLWSGRLAEPDGFQRLVDHLLDSPHFGERWARHWMDWIRYADSHGSEGDPEIVNGWQYRDYLIRALNADVPYDQLVREHVAGDLLDKPRLNQKLGINESSIGPAHWRMVFHGFAPVDALDERVRSTDDQINAFSKAFLGLTVSCARCHDHKFDAISQRDYYALFGILGSSRPARVAIDSPEKLGKNRDKLAELKPKIRSAVADAWLDHGARLHQQLLSDDGPTKKADKPGALLHPWFLMRGQAADKARFSEAWLHQVESWTNDRKVRETHRSRVQGTRWNLNEAADYARWFRHGEGLPDRPSAAGEFSVAATGEKALTGIYPSGVYTHGLSAKHSARLESGYLRLDGDYDLWLRVVGDGSASVRYVVQDYPRDGTVYPIARPSPEWRWQKFDLAYWNGDEFHIELATGKDAPLMVNDTARSWFGIREALMVRKGEPGPPMDSREYLDPLFRAAIAAKPVSLDQLAASFSGAVCDAVRSWQGGSLDDAQAALLGKCLDEGLLPNRVDELAAAKPLIEEYRRLEEDIPVPTRVPSLEETVGRNQHLFERGDHKRPGVEVPRRFLEAIDATPYKTELSGRRQLAEDLLRDDNPFTRRVIVNRIWHHLLGRGIVPTPDNFGRLGQEPTHPELLDFLATRFKDQGWSIKDAIRFIVLSKSWQLSSRPSQKARQVDPANQLLSHAHVRRMDAESIRDSLLAISGSLDRDLFGTPVGGNSPRRSVYVRVQRNALDPFLRVFDFPEPFSAVGSRDVTNVPAQSLTLMNDDRVASLAANWAAKILSDGGLADEDLKIQKMFLTALGRPAQTDELARFKAHLAETRAGHATLSKQRAAVRLQMDRHQSEIRSLIEPARARLLKAAGDKSRSPGYEHALPKPIGRWEFADGFRDSVGSAHGKALSGARIEGGALVVGNQAHVITAPLAQAIREKTLEAWVQLDDLDQRGGGVMTIQSPDGAVFDAIVFGEQAPRQWLAGSNVFSRTQPFQGAPEQEAARRPVHLAIAYHADGRIVGYRDGQPYGMPYKSNGPTEFKAGRAVIGFGIRHLPVGDNRMLSGRLLQAQIYDRALSAEEVQASSRSAPEFVSESQVLATLTESERERISHGRARIRELEAEVLSFGAVPDSGDEQAAWTDLARAIFTFKELIYVK
ncbi:MAG: hypothetical protein JWN86_1453 [Planctomycetota bacterium]|nr:hypothetical protein [Planctomycetota bacterium]